MVKVAGDLGEVANVLSDRGFLVYVTRTYPAMVPYLKGFHLTIEMWHGGRDPEGWKLRPGYASALSEDASTPDGMEDEDEAAANHRIMIKSGAAGHAYAPEDGLTTPVPRFRDAINALIQLSNFDLPPLRVVWPAHIVHVYYGFGDASGKQFGATLSESYSCRQQLSNPLAEQLRRSVPLGSLDSRGGGGELKLQ